MTDWPDELAALNAEFRTQGGAVMDLYVTTISTEEWTALQRAAADGNAQSRLIVESLKRWHQTMSRAAADDHWPGCGCCMKALKRGDVFGFAVLMPQEKTGVGMVAAFCQKCIKLDRDELIGRFLAAFEREFNAELESIH